MTRYLKAEQHVENNSLNASSKSTVLVNELRVWKEKVNRLQLQKERDEGARRNQEVQTASVQNENR